MLNATARELWTQYQAETDPEAREMLYSAYARALDEVGVGATEVEDVEPGASGA